MTKLVPSTIHEKFLPPPDVPLQPFEERAAKERCKPIDTPQQRNKDYLQGKALTALNPMPSHHARRGFQAWRQFTSSQLRNHRMTCIRR